MKVDMRRSIRWAAVALLSVATTFVLVEPKPAAKPGTPAAPAKAS